MVTVKEYRALAKDYRLSGRSKLNKYGLIKLIAEARAPEFLKRFWRANKTGRFPALLGDRENPHKRAQRGRELHRLDDEVNAALRASAYEKRVAKDPA